MSMNESKSPMYIFINPIVYNFPMSKHKKRVAVEKQNFPQISRIIPELIVKTSHFLMYQKGRLRRNASFLIFGGLLLLGVINVMYQRKIPATVDRLLQDPTDTQSLQEVLKESRNPAIVSEIVSVLSQSGNENVAASIQEEKNRLYETINRITLIIRNNPRYPDAYAYRAVLYLKLHECVLSSKDMQTARTMDPNRKIFEKLAQSVAACR